MTYDEDNDIFLVRNLMLVGLNKAEARWQSPAGDAPRVIRRRNFY